MTVTPGPGLNLFSSREQENEQRAHLLKRLSFAIFCSDVDQYVRSMPDIQERLVDSLRAAVAPVLQAEVFYAFRVLLLRVSAHNVTSLWPIIISELVSCTHITNETSEAEPIERLLFSFTDSRPSAARTRTHSACRRQQKVRKQTILTTHLFSHLDSVAS